MATQKRHQEALLYLRRANELAPDDDTVLHELACSLIDIEAYPEAIQYLKSLLKRTPTHINALIDLGIAYTAQGFLEEAENVLGQALEHDEFDFGAHYHIAALYAASERFGEAFDHLDVCLGQDRSKCLMWMRDDSIFDTLRDNKRFEELMRKGQDYEDPPVSNDTREITGVHDISGTIYREVGPSFKKVLGTDTDLDGSGVRRIWHRGARKTELLTWEAEDGAIVRQELTFQNLLIETNQTGIVRTGLIPQEGSVSTPQSVEFSSSPDSGVLKMCDAPGSHGRARRLSTPSP